MEKQIANKSTLLNLLFIVIVGIGAMCFVFKGDNGKNIMNALYSVNIKYVIIGVILSLLFIIGDAINTKQLFGIIGYKIPFVRTIKYAFIGFLFSSLTPSATGGQPMQIYSMKKDNIEVSHSSLVLLIELMSYQIASFTYGLVGCIWFRNSEIFTSGIITYLIIIGFIINLAGVIFIGLSIFKPNISRKISSGLGMLIKKMPFIREEKKDSLIQAVKKQIEEYNASRKYLKENKKVLARVIVISLLQMACIFSISYVVYLALGQTGKSLVEIMLIQSLVYMGSSFVPLPGGSGVSETGFLILFRQIYPENLIGGALLLSRGISFYLLIIISIVVLGIYRAFGVKKVRYARENNQYFKT